MKEKMVIIHPALAPYRVDFFNSINSHFNATFYFQYKHPLEQKFNNKRIQSLTDFKPIYLRKSTLKKNLHLDVFSILYKEKPKYILCSEYNILDCIIIVYRYLFNRKMMIISICDDNYLMAVECKGVKKWIRAILLRLYDGVILADKKAYSWYKQKFQNHTNFLYFPIIQDEKKFAISLSEAKMRSLELIREYDLEDKKTILYVGRLVDIKNVGVLLEIFPSIIAEYPNTRLIIVGEGNQKDHLVHKANELDIKHHVIFAGKQEGNELYAWYRLSDIFILPSIFEPFGAVTNEALLANCYLFCSNKAGSASIIHEPENGMLFEPENKKEMQEKLSNYIKRTQKEKKDHQRHNMLFDYESTIMELISSIKAIH
jgi:glycosyltransferase involved in cell wall biosynthesis